MQRTQKNSFDDPAAASRLISASKYSNQKGFWTGQIEDINRDTNGNELKSPNSKIHYDSLINHFQLSDRTYYQKIFVLTFLSTCMKLNLHLYPPLNVTSMEDLSLQLH